MSGYSLTNGKALKYKPLLCFCSACMHGHWRRCSNLAHVASWDFVTLEPSYDIEEEEIDDPSYEGHHDALIDALLMGITLLFQHLMTMSLWISMF